MLLFTSIAADLASTVLRALAAAARKSVVPLLKTQKRGLTPPFVLLLI